MRLPAGARHAAPSRDRGGGGTHSSATSFNGMRELSLRVKLKLRSLRLPSLVALSLASQGSVARPSSPFFAPTCYSVSPASQVTSGLSDATSLTFDLSEALACFGAQPTQLDLGLPTHSARTLPALPLARCSIPFLF